jgi:hypothetical protein
VAGYVFTQRKARKYHRCEVCRGDINPGDECLTATIGGGGLGSLKFPDYLHPWEKEQFKKMKEARLGNTNG